MSYFWSPNKGLREEEEEEGEEEEEREKSSQGMDTRLLYGSLEFGMEFEYGIERFCPKTTCVWIAWVFFGH